MPLDAGAVEANAERWRSDPVGRSLVPGLLAVAAPRPDAVRLILAEPLTDLPARLADPRLGIVSPPALASESGVGASFLGARRAGSGPFELRGRVASITVLDRNRRWWGSDLQLGPCSGGGRLPDRARRDPPRGSAPRRRRPRRRRLRRRRGAGPGGRPAAGGGGRQRGRARRGRADRPPAPGSASSARSAASTAPRRPRCPASGWPCWADQAELGASPRVRAAVSLHGPIESRPLAGAPHHAGEHDALLEVRARGREEPDRQLRTAVPEANPTGRLSGGSGGREDVAVPRIRTSQVKDTRVVRSAAEPVFVTVAPQFRIVSDSS